MNKKWTIICVSTLMLLASLYGYCNRKTPDNPRYRWELAQKYILENLTSPLTAKIYPPEANQYDDDFLNPATMSNVSVYFISGKIDAQNAFGTYLRKNYVVALKSDTLELELVDFYR